MRFGASDLLLHGDSPLGESPRGSGTVGAPPSSQLHDNGGGTKRAETGEFKITVGRDGVATIEDKPNLQVQTHWVSPEGVKQDLRNLKRGLAAWLTDPYAVKKLGVGLLPPDAKINEDEAWKLPSGQESAVVKGWQPQTPLLSGRFDLTDWAMRAHGHDPYAAKKLAILDGSREERVAMAEQRRREYFDHSAAIAQQQVEALWSRTEVDLPMKRELLFELWDDCAEGDDALGRAGAAARGEVLGFIRTRLPVESSVAYPPGDLVELNKKRHSKQAFTPYESAP